MTKREEESLSIFCKRILDHLEGRKPKPHWFSKNCGLCYNYFKFTIWGGDLKEMVGWKMQYPWGDYHYTREDIYKNPRRLAFIKKWANKN
jgi:hypothetical protein